jgi:threonine dehydrogenase-like Zn-dependent dehydrogenase
VNPPGAKVEIEPYDLFMRELTISAVYMRPFTFGRAMRWLGKLDFQAILGPYFPLDQTLQAIHAMRDKKGVKPVVTPNA